MDRGTHPLKAENQLQDKFSAFASTGTKLEPVFSEVATRLCDRLLDTKRTFPLALDIGTGHGTVRRALPTKKQPEVLIEADFSGPVLSRNTGPFRLQMDGEAPFPFTPRTFDLILSNLMLPWVKNVPKFLAQSGRVLKEDGLFLASTLGQDSFVELRTAFEDAGSNFPHTNPMPDVQTVGEALQSVGFAMPVIDRDWLVLEYKNFDSLWADLKAMGATNTHPARRRGLTTPRQLEAMKQAYKDQFARPDGTLPLTLEVIYLHGWRPHKSQQKPLPRGSGQVDLSEVLGRK